MAKEEEPAGVRISMTFRKLADLYLEEVQRIRKPNTYRIHKYVLQTFCDRIGKKRVADLRVLHVTEWFSASKRNESTVKPSDEQREKAPEDLFETRR